MPCCSNVYCACVARFAIVQAFFQAFFCGKHYIPNRTSEVPIRYVLHPTPGCDTFLTNGARYGFVLRCPSGGTLFTLTCSGTYQRVVCWGMLPVWFGISVRDEFRSGGLKSLALIFFPSPMLARKSSGFARIFSDLKNSRAPPPHPHGPYAYVVRNRYSYIHVVQVSLLRGMCVYTAWVRHAWEFFNVPLVITFDRFISGLASHEKIVYW